MRKLLSEINVTQRSVADKKYVMAANARERTKLQKCYIWVSQYERCLSFHDEPYFERVEFWDTQTMWEKVFEYLDYGYRVK